MRLANRVVYQERYTLITDSQDLEPIVAELGITQFASEITGALIDLEKAFEHDCDKYPDIWLTESSKPWSIFAEWERPAYYADEIPEELDLQD